MKGRYIRNQGFLLLLLISSVKGTLLRSCQSFPLRSHYAEAPRDRSSYGGQDEGLADLQEKIMNSWSEVNIARAISSHNAEAFHHRIVKAHLELYAALCSIASKNFLLSHELLPVYRMLKGLCLSHDAWCAEQRRATTVGAYCLMLAIMHVWCFATKGLLPNVMEQSIDLLEREEDSEFSNTTPQ